MPQQITGMEELSNDVRSANRDPDFRNTKSIDDARFDALVRNVYKVLLTRGMIGTSIYSPDPETREALTRLVGVARDRP